MPDITGSSQSDVIVVENDTGTLNGAQVAGPIVNITARLGDDQVTINNSTISGDILTQSGSDTVSITDSTVNNAALGGDNDTLTVSGSTITGVLSGNVGDDTFTITDSDVASISLGGDNDTLIFENSTSTGTIGGNVGEDHIIVRGSQVASVGLGIDDDMLTLIDSTVTGGLSGSSGFDILNLPAGTAIQDNTHGAILVAANGSYPLSRGTLTLPTGQVVTYSTFEEARGLVCFVGGTMIETDKGEIAIENLRPGDMIATLDQGFQPLRWIGTRHISADTMARTPAFRPVCIQAGALGHNMPTHDLYLSPQHNVLIRSRIVERICEAEEILIPCLKLAGQPGVERPDTEGSITYYHLLFDAHHIIRSAGAWTESFFPGPLAMKSITAEDRRDIRRILQTPNHECPNLPPARPQVRKNKIVQELLRCHKKNAKVLVSA
ncbi:Hint domain-containing protein [Halocynthiibacter styelae]|uniref:Hint domain-containing protein n=1 Tax=Halocynthiibacter styelae TaxID=2761955 RepID=A0A8J7IYD9_9RHOB|nr:Hint domain-containing protein [Paenihalocynthiibacter styelae]MBI1494494.1 Hint domain-containing protein [Paenihalocynthiibacter styelae]